MAAGLKFVAVEVADISTVVVLVIVWTWAGRTFVGATSSQGGGMEGVDRPAIGSEQGDMGAVADRRGLSVVRQTDEELSWLSGRTISDQAVLQHGEGPRQTQSLEGCVVKRRGFVQVVRTQGNVAVHRFSPRLFLHHISDMA